MKNDLLFVIGEVLATETELASVTYPNNAEIDGRMYLTDKDGGRYELTLKEIGQNN